MLEVLEGGPYPTLTAATCLSHAEDPNENEAGGGGGMRRRTFLRLAGSAGAGLSTFPALVRAQAPWPNKPVRMMALYQTVPG
jgi:hypothetical protein